MARFRTQSWMGDLSDSLARKRLPEILLPGTHNAGSYSCSARQVAPFAPSLAKHPCACLWCCVSNNFSRCQNADLAAQLRAGARYLDVRVCYDKKRAMLRTEHSLYGAPLADMFAQVAGFVARYPSEIVIVELRHFQVNKLYDMEAKHHEELVGIIKESFRMESLITSDEVASLTYDDLRAKGKNVVLVYNNECPTSLGAGQAALFCRPAAVVSWWTNSQTADQLTTRIERLQSSNSMEHASSGLRLRSRLTTLSSRRVSSIVLCAVFVDFCARAMPETKESV